MTAGFVVAFIVVSGALVYMQASVIAWLAWTVIWVSIGWLAGITGPIATTLLTLLFVVPTLVLAIKPLRRTLLSQRVLNLFRKILPQMSQTERDAIEAGTVWWDAELFTGRPDWNKLLAYPPTLTAEEQAFLDAGGGAVPPGERLGGNARSGDLSPQTWQYIKDKGFLGMIIPKQYGGTAVLRLAPFAGGHETLDALLGRRRLGDGAELARAGRVADALRHRGAEEPLSAAPRARRRNPLLRADQPLRRLGCRRDSRYRHRLPGYV